MLVKVWGIQHMFALFVEETDKLLVLIAMAEGIHFTNAPVVTGVKYVVRAEHMMLALSVQFAMAMVI
jgi:hypothetical protein